MPITAQVDGIGNFEFPDGTSPDVVHAAVQKAVMAHNAPAPLSGPIAGGSEVPDPINTPSVLNQAQAYDTVKGMAKGALGTMHAIHNFNAPSDPRNSMYVDQDKYPGSDINTTASNPDQMVGKGIETGLEMLGGGEGAGKVLPSAKRAGQVFESISKDAAKAPVTLNKAAEPILELYDLANTGSNIPKGVRQLLSRATQPDGNPILYPEARKFASRISSSSVAERLTGDPNMKRVLGSLREAFNSDVADAAASVGRGDEHQQAMQEFANARKLKRVGAAGGSAVAGGLGIGAKLGVLGHIISGGQ